MMVNILMGRTALHRVEEFYENLDVPFLFRMDAHASNFNDSVLGRTLDKIFEAGPKRVFSSAALLEAMLEEVEVGVVHVDTTSWSLACLLYTSDHRRGCSRWVRTRKLYSKSASSPG